MKNTLIQLGDNPQSLIQALKYVSINKKDISFKVIGKPNNLVTLSSEKNIRIVSDASFYASKENQEDRLGLLLKTLSEDSYSGLIIQKLEAEDYTDGLINIPSEKLMTLRGFSEKPFFVMLVDSFQKSDLLMKITDSRDFILKSTAKDSFSYSVLSKDSEIDRIKDILNQLITDTSFKGITSFKNILAFTGDLLVCQEDDILPFLEGLKAGIRSYDAVQNKKNRADFRSSIKSRFYSKMSADFRSSMNWIFSDLSYIYLIDKKPVGIISENSSLTGIISAINQII